MGTLSSINIKFAIANVQTLAPRGEAGNQANGLGSLVTGKIQRLERSFHDAGLGVIGVQESRIQCDTDERKDYYHIIGSAATSSGTLGVQVWIALGLRAKIVEFIPASPRILLIVVVINHVQFLIGVGHAPINGDENAAEFYRVFSTQLQALRCKYPEAHLVLLADLNAQVGSVSSPHIGNMLPEAENSNGEHMRT